MASIITTPIEENETLRRIGADYLPTTLAETVRETWGSSQYETNLLSTNIDIWRESGQADEQMAGDFMLSQGRDKPELSPLVSPEELNSKYSNLGLKFKEPTRQRVAEIIAQQKRDQLREQSVIQRGPQGIIAGGARLSTAILRSVIDPINLASAFVPVVGEARYLAMVAKAGVPAARVAKGVIEGSVGAAMTEPFVYSASNQQQLDYTMADSLVNIAFGGILGGGLHLAAGKVGDLIKARNERASSIEAASQLDAATREAALIKGISDAVDGRVIDVQPAIDIGQRLRGETALGRLGTLSVTPREDLDVQVPVTREKSGAPIKFKSQSSAIKAASEETIRSGSAVQVKQAPDGSYVLTRKTTANFVYDADQNVRTFDTESEAVKQSKKIADKKQQGKRTLREKLEPIPIIANGEKKFALVRGASKEDLTGFRSQPMEVSADKVEYGGLSPREKTLQPRSIIESDSINKFGLARRSARSTNRKSPDVVNPIPKSADSVANPEASRAAQEYIDESVEDFGIEESMEFDANVIDSLDRKGILSIEEKAELQAADEGIRKANGIAKAAAEAANCLLGK